MTYFSFSWWYKFNFYINYLSISSLNSINVSLSSWLFLIAFLSLNSTKFSLDLSLMNSFPLNTFILIFVLKFFCSYICVHLKHQLQIVYFSSCLFDIRSLLDCSPASCSFFSSFLSSFFFSSFCFSGSSFWLYPRGFWLKVFSFWKKPKGSCWKAKGRRRGSRRRQRGWRKRRRRTKSWWPFQQ